MIYHQRRGCIWQFCWMLIFALTNVLTKISMPSILLIYVRFLSIYCNSLSVVMCPPEYCVLMSSACCFPASFYLWSCRLTTMYIMPHLFISVHKVPLFGFSVYNLVINVNNSPWCLCFFHVAERLKISIKMYFWLDLNKFVMWCSRKWTKSSWMIIMALFSCHFCCMLIFCAKTIQRVI